MFKRIKREKCVRRKLEKLQRQFSSESLTIDNKSETFVAIFSSIWVIIFTTFSKWVRYGGGRIQIEQSQGMRGGRYYRSHQSSYRVPDTQCLTAHNVDILRDYECTWRQRVNVGWVHLEVSSATKGYVKN